MSSTSDVFQLSDQVIGSFPISSPVKESFPFYECKFLKSCTILGGQQVSQLYTKLCWIFILFQLDFFSELKLASVFPGLTFFLGFLCCPGRELCFIAVCLSVYQHCLTWQFHERDCCEHNYFSFVGFGVFLAFSGLLRSNKWPIKFKCKKILIIYLHNASLCCWNLLLNWSMAVSQGSKERAAEAEPAPFSGHPLLHCTQHLHAVLFAVMLKAWWMVLCPPILAINCLSKIDSDTNKGAHHPAHSSGMCSPGTREMSQGWTQPCFSFAALSFFIHDSCQSLLTLKQSPRMSHHALSPSNYICGITSHIQSLPCS